jgi:hypothetical protein
MIRRFDIYNSAVRWFASVNVPNREALPLPSVSDPVFIISPVTPVSLKHDGKVSGDSFHKEQEKTGETGVTGDTNAS